MTKEFLKNYVLSQLSLRGTSVKAIAIDTRRTVQSVYNILYRDGSGHKSNRLRLRIAESCGAPDWPALEAQAKCEFKKLHQS